MKRKAERLYSPADVNLASARLKLYDELLPEVQEEIDRIASSLGTAIHKRSSKAQLGVHGGREVVMALLQHDLIDL